MKPRVPSLVPVLFAVLGLSLLLVTFGQPVQADPGDVLVSRATGSDQANCGDGVNPRCYSIKYAVENVAVAGDRVLVAAGIYTETFAMQPGVAIVSQSGPALTRIDGQGVRGPMVTASGQDIASTARLEGFLVMNGNNRGILISGASPLISDCIIFNNRGSSDGGGIKVEQAGAEPLISDTEFFSNTAEDNGGAVGVTNDASLILLHSDVLSNTAGGHGGGVAGTGATTLTISRTVFVGNEGKDGGGVRSRDSDLTLWESVFVSNTARTGGGAVVVSGDSEFVIFDNLVERNEAVQDCGIYIEETEPGTIVSNTLRLNKSTQNVGGAIAIVNATALISGNTIISNTVENQSGGGIYVYGVAADVRVFNNKIMSNMATHGGGILAHRGEAEIISNTIAFNEASDGGAGIEIGDGATAVISGNLVLSNTCPTASGGGVLVGGGADVEIRDNEIAHNVGTYATAIRFSNSSGEIHDNTIHHNLEAEPSGGGRAIYLEGTASVQVYRNWISDNEGGGLVSACSRATLTNNMIVRNTGSNPQVSVPQGTTPALMNNSIVGSGLGNGIEVKHGSVPTLTNNIVVSNVTGIWGDGGSVPVLINNLLWDNSTADYANMDPGDSDVSCDPVFVNAAADDYRLGICSCAVDAGTNAGAPGKDYERNARPVDGHGEGTATVDIGAYERLTVTAPWPEVDFTYFDNAGGLVNFANTSKYAVSYAWDFGDGVGTSTAVNPNYTYAGTGPYVISLTGTNSFGCIGVYQDTVELRQHLNYLPVVVRPNP